MYEIKVRRLPHAGAPAKRPACRLARRRAATTCRRRHGRLPDGVSANGSLEAVARSAPWRHPPASCEKLIVSRKLAHGGNPVTRWMAANVAVTQDDPGRVAVARPRLWTWMMVECCHAQGNRDRRECRGSCSARGDRRGSQQPAETRLAGADHPRHRRRLRHRRDHAPGGRGQAQRVALARALHGRGRRRPAARQDPAGAHPAARQDGGRGRRDAHARPGAAR